MLYVAVGLLVVVVLQLWVILAEAVALRREAATATKVLGQLVEKVLDVREAINNQGSLTRRPVETTLLQICGTLEAIEKRVAAATTPEAPQLLGVPPKHERPPGE